MNQLAQQVHVDPDEIFQQRQRTCALDDVFSAPGDTMRPAYADWRGKGGLDTTVNYDRLLFSAG